MSRHLTPADLPEDAARFAEAQIAVGRFASVDDFITAGMVAIQERDDAEQEWLAYAQKEAAEGFAELDRGEGTRGTPAEIMAAIDAEVSRQGGA